MSNVSDGYYCVYKITNIINNRKEYCEEDLTMMELAKKYGVSKKTILNIIHNKIYTGKY